VTVRIISRHYKKIIGVTINHCSFSEVASTIDLLDLAGLQRDNMNTITPALENRIYTFNEADHIGNG
jgi:RNA:NAD 2'-phosphotransferase (TPT1/KptA family)